MGAAFSEKDRPLLGRVCEETGADQELAERLLKLEDKYPFFNRSSDGASLQRDISALIESAVTKENT